MIVSLRARWEFHLALGRRNEANLLLPIGTDKAVMPDRYRSLDRPPRSLLLHEARAVVGSGGKASVLLRRSRSRAAPRSSPVKAWKITPHGLTHSPVAPDRERHEDRHEPNDPRERARE